MRSAARAADVAAVLPGVELVEADLNSGAGWAEAVAGCRYVLHTASPFPSPLATVVRSERGFS